jgi:hypothetical protein
VTAARITDSLPDLNDIFAPAGVEFVFDETRDFTTLNSTLLNREFTVLESPNAPDDEWDQEPLVDEKTHDDARTALAIEFPGKIVLIFHHRVKLAKNPDTGNWRLVAAGGASSATAAYVNLRSDTSATSLGHEIGHYLQLAHTFEKGIVEGGHPKSDGLNALDYDRGAVLDTPADVAGAIWEDAGFSDKCDPNTIQIPVTFEDSTARSYELAPDRSLVMSYFKGCPGPKTLSPQQARRVRDGLELRLRQNLITLKASTKHKIVRGATGAGGAISGLDMALVRGGRVVTAVRDGEKHLKLIAWDIAEDARQISRVGDASGGAVEEIAVCGLGMNMVATAVSDRQDLLKVIVWRVKENGDIVRLSDVTVTEHVNNVAVSTLLYSMDKNFFCTVSRTKTGKLRADVWRVFADGRLVFKTHDDFLLEVVPPPNAKTPLSLNRTGKASVVANYVDRSGNYRTILWRYDSGQNKLIRKEMSVDEGANTGRVSGCAVAREISVAAIEGANGSLKVFGFRFGNDGANMELREAAGAGRVSEVDVCNLGTEMVVTSVRTADDHLKVILWGVGRTGSPIYRITDASAEEDFSRLATCQVARSQFATAIRDKDGTLKVIVWRIPPTIVGGLVPSHSDDFAHLFRNATLEKKSLPTIDFDCDTGRSDDSDA